MKFLRNALIGGAVGFLGFKKIQAVKKRQSLRSLLVEETLGKVTATPNFSLVPPYDEAFERSLKPYQLPKEAEFLYGFRPYEHFTDTFEYLPQNGVQEQVIFYLHGGAYWGQPVGAHFRTLARLGRKTRARIVMPVYPKAPAYKAQDAYEMILDRYLYLLKTKKIEAQNITFAGDSAGGGFVIGLLNRLKEHGYPLPRQVIALSPWLDITTSNEQIPAFEEVDPMLDRRIADMGRIFAGTMAVDDPLISPIHGDYSEMPPITIFIGTHDILYPDVEEFRKKAEAKGWSVTVYKYQKMIHVFPVFSTPEAADALAEIARIIRK